MPLVLGYLECEAVTNQNRFTYHSKAIRLIFIESGRSDPLSAPSSILINRLVTSPAWAGGGSGRAVCPPGTRRGDRVVTLRVPAAAVAITITATATILAAALPRPPDLASYLRLVLTLRIRKTVVEGIVGDDKDNVTIDVAQCSIFHIKV